MNDTILSKMFESENQHWEHNALKSQLQLYHHDKHIYWIIVSSRYVHALTHLNIKISILQGISWD